MVGEVVDVLQGGGDADPAPDEDAHGAGSDRDVEGPVEELSEGEDDRLAEERDLPPPEAPPGWEDASSEEEWT